MQPDLRVLTVTSYGETPEEDLRVTLNGQVIKMVAAKDVVAQGRSAKETTILFMDSEPVTLILNLVDLMQLESVIGAYSFE